MNQDQFVEVTITEPSEVPISDIAAPCPTKGLSKIHECDNSCIYHSHVHNNLSSKKLKCNVFTSSEQKADLLRNSSKPLDIELLLRYYACNSDMERSINKVLERTQEKYAAPSNDPSADQVCRDIDQGPLIELSASYKIFESLKQSSLENTSFSLSRFQDILIKLRSLIGRCNNVQLDEILSNDPSLKICKHCGVISCLEPPNLPAESRKSPPRTSYFLNTQTLSSKIDSNRNKIKIRKNTEKFNPRKEYNTKRSRKHIEASRDTRPFVHNRYKIDKIDKVNINTPRQDEIMIAERENANEKQQIKTTAGTNVSDRNKIRTDGNRKSHKMEVQNSVNGSRMTKLLPFEEEKFKMVTIDETAANNGSNSNFVSDLSRARFNSQKERKKTELLEKKRGSKRNEYVNRNRRNDNESEEKIIKDIVYVKSKSQLNLKAQNGMTLNNTHYQNRKQNRSFDSPNNIHSIIDTIAYLARGRCEAKEKEFVSQFDERTFVQSRFSDKHSFVLHGSRDDNPQLDAGFLMCDESRHPYGNPKLLSKNGHNNSKYWKSGTAATNFKESSSFTCSMEDDSLENCAKACTAVDHSESDTTVYSSSSAENMIRKWVKPSRDSEKDSVQHEMCKRSISSKVSITGLYNDSDISWIKEKCVNCPQMSDREEGMPCNCWDHSLNKQTAIDSPVEQTKSYTINKNPKLPNSHELISDGKRTSNSTKIETGSRKFGKQLFGSLRSIMSMKFLKSKNNNSNNKLRRQPSNSSPSREYIRRQITYNESSFGNMIETDNRCGDVAKILSVYQRILESTKEMDWETFKRFVEILHPNEKHLWRDICRAISNEARRIADKDDDNTEVCIEISSVPCKKTKDGERTCSNEIVFEMDMTLGDVESFLGWKLASSEEEQLDTLKRASKAIKVRNDDVYDTEVVSNQAE